ncbi:MAG: hypothetical protein A4E49_00413 [Methanosaeta sp. PtaU1.Bin112]|jgi:CHASE3 domain sensor protein|nr:MAG: hypothetical protein A4E49_00413 [Methanosaeta sp. PtaU1.Bin112]
MSEVATASLNTFGKASPESHFVPLFRTALELTRTDPEQPRIEPNHPIELEPSKAASDEIARLQEKIGALTEENRLLKESTAKQETSDPKSFFDMLERISVDILAPILEHEATDSNSRDIARELRVRPDELRHYLIKGEKSYLEAIAELSPFLKAAKNKLMEKRKRGAAEGNNDHRAKLLLEKLELRREIRIAQAIDIIDGDEGARPNYAMARRAMKRAAEIEPNNVLFIQGVNGGIGSILKWR